MELPIENANGLRLLPNWKARASFGAPEEPCGANLRGIACDFRANAKVLGAALRVRFVEAKDGSFLQCHFGEHVYFGLQQQSHAGPSHLILTSWLQAERFVAGRLAISPPKRGGDPSYCPGSHQLDLSETVVGEWIDLACIIQERFVVLYIRPQGEKWSTFAGFQSRSDKGPYASSDGVSFLIENYKGVFPERRAAIEVSRVGLLTFDREWRDPESAQIVLPTDPRFDPKQDRLVSPDQDLREDPRRHVWYGYDEGTVALLQGPWQADYRLELPVRGVSKIEIPKGILRSLSWDGECLPSSSDA